MKQSDLVIMSTGEDRAEWLAARTGVVTATQAAAIAGSHPYVTITDVWNEHTDPEHTDDPSRFRWTQDRIDLGVAREPHIIAWASEDERTGGAAAPFEASSALMRHKDVPPNRGCTPDGLKWVRGKLVLLEAKTTGKDWEATGIPAHVYDQCQWQLDTTKATTVWLAVETYEWTGRGKAKVPVLVKTWLHPIQRDESRLAFLHERVAEFEGWKADGIAPETVLDLATAYVVGFDDTPEEAAAKMADAAEAAHIESIMDEAAEIKRELAAPQARLAEIEEEVKTYVKSYDGRRVELISEQLTTKLSRSFTAKRDPSKLDEATLRSITTWPESQRVTLALNPDYTPPTTPESE